MRTVRTGSGATALQIVHGSRRGSRDVEHLGSAHDAQAVEALKAARALQRGRGLRRGPVTRQWPAGGQGELDLGVDTDALAAGGAGSLQVASSPMTPLWDALRAVYDQLGSDTVTDHDQVFRQLVRARIIEPTSKADSLRVLAEAGIDSPATANRRGIPSAAPAA
ncbi:hypothetical protein GCM10023320_82210 [Pseudonocardia adelaidensis]|uniref:Uncharacterized protein n=1 Tax=Pseudonocardia adelaidensis TaxID=648754 RepID=A0ABP9P8M6_9PSEU